ncbi:alanine racemase [Arcobacter nitrofigilis DSM 7299]|uniref:Alanine racemase n=1 Tax=Arcobacter nitrofigilis (strain ATCC 33309 / DSM 7299 / CCUG 15893 / LMG 7604 / NCTC 12251 / CI) TaxID=572480 RepID=D5V329_ARCNC|nr:alanine racemase [Arcobacter nitrofigilis]ADG92611.1 alanine racemase [Arcobacter nitrofigilis DSM 7299]
MDLSRAVWTEINLDNLAHNMRETRRITNIDSKITAVIKADGYGHGAVAIAKTLLENGADRFAVATLSEALLLRNSFSDVEILVLGYTPEHLAKDIIENNIIQTIYTLKQAKEFSRVAISLNKNLVVHIKLDTGMHRLGMPFSEETIETILDISKHEGLFIEGIFTHFAIADNIDKKYTKQQVEKFTFIVNSLEEKGLNIPIKHVSNSAAIIDLPEFNFDMVRAGIMLYGLYPSKDVNHNLINLKEVMCLKANISQVKELEANCGVSYGLTYKCEKKSKVATLPIGYADGYTRMLSGKAKVLVNNTKVPVIGSICMDQCIIDVTGLDVNMGDEVILFGGNNPNAIAIDDISNLLNTINYEIVCMIDKRVPRVYIKNGKEINYNDYNLMLFNKITNNDNEY